MSDNKSDKLIFLGQEIPLNWYSVLIIFLLCVTALIFYSGIRDKDSFFRALVIGGLYDGEGQTTSGREPTVLYKIWTPSPKTWDNITLEEKNKLKFDSIANWYQTSDKVVIRFGEALMDLGALGYNRVECWGQGTSGLKQGFIWYITFPEDVRLKSVTRLYKKYFNRDRNIYIETYNISWNRHDN